jgi:DNA-binding NtrC family response regulator
VPPLRERKDDIPLLANHFRLRFAEENHVEPPALTPETLSRMMAHDWPGNVRELENFMERAVIMYASARSIPFDLVRKDAAGEGATALERASREGWDLDRLEREYILGTLERNHWQHGVSAKLLGINRRTLYRKLKSYREEGHLAEVREG